MIPLGHGQLSGTDSIVAEVGKACPHPAPAPIRQTQAARHIPRTTMAHLARFQARRKLSLVALITVIPRPRTVNKVVPRRAWPGPFRIRPSPPTRRPPVPTALSPHPVDGQARLTEPPGVPAEEATDKPRIGGSLLLRYRVYCPQTIDC